MWYASIHVPIHQLCVCVYVYVCYAPLAVLLIDSLHALHYAHPTLPSTHIHIYTYTHTHTYTYIYIYIYIYTHPTGRHSLQSWQRAHWYSDRVSPLVPTRRRKSERCVAIFRTRADKQRGRSDHPISAAVRRVRVCVCGRESDHPISVAVRRVCEAIYMCVCSVSKSNAHHEYTLRPYTH
jgi:hypothetical protein